MGALVKNRFNEVSEWERVLPSVKHVTPTAPCTPGTMYGSFTSLYCTITVLVYSSE